MSTDNLTEGRIVDAQRRFKSTAERLPTLFSLSDEFVEILGLLENAGEGHESELELQLSEVAAVLAQKVERCAWTVLDCERLAKARKAEADRLRDQAARLDRVAITLRLKLLDAMRSTHQERVDTTRFSISIRQNPARVEVLDASLVPAEFQRTKVLVDVDKTAVREHWKSTGEIVAGTDIVRGERVHIA